MWQHSRVGYLTAIGSVLLATLVSIPLYPRAVDFPSLILLGAVSATASIGGFGPAMASALFAFLALDFFFEFPPYTFEVTALGTSFDLLAFLLVAVLLGTLNSRLRDARQRAVAARAEAFDALRARDEALAIVSHDLRTPLTAIKTSVSTLRSPGAPLAEPTRYELLGTIEAEADRLVHFVSDALAMSRLEAGIVPDPQWNALGEIVSAVLDRLALVLGDRPISFDVPDTLPLARFDASLLDQALSNLLENIAVHTPPGTPIAIRGQIEDDCLSLEVDDGGPGIPRSERERVFGKFERVKEASSFGTGLGLAIARAAAEAQGGSLWLEDSALGGARFVLKVPDVQAAEAVHAR